jgi:hypothetical protein
MSAVLSVNLALTLLGTLIVQVSCRCHADFLGRYRSRIAAVGSIDLRYATTCVWADMSVVMFISMALPSVTEFPIGVDGLELTAMFEEFDQSIQRLGDSHF